MKFCRPNAEEVNFDIIAGQPCAYNVHARPAHQHGVAVSSNSVLHLTGECLLWGVLMCCANSDSTKG